MGWSIKTNNKDKWSVYSSVSDSVIAMFNTEKELVNFLALDKIYVTKKKAIELLMTFPNDWTVNDERTITEDRRDKLDLYFNWEKSIFKAETYEEYYKLIDDKLEELMGS